MDGTISAAQNVRERSNNLKENIIVLIASRNPVPTHKGPNTSPIESICIFSASSSDLLQDRIEIDFWPQFLANSWGKEFVAGGFGGMAGVVSGYPLDTVRIRQQQSGGGSRYRVVIHVEDDSGTTSFTLFNKEAEQLIGIPMQKILAEIEENDNVTQIPAAIRNIVGKVCTFQIKVNKYNITHACEEYAVIRVLESSTLPNSDPHTDSVATLNKKQRTS
ncbi:hypothetical protein POM88_015926 [Heracleum sosnowskyi]|uniref:Replication factor A C-terminal domain-containing protein n=1 Tax=Heracleum sosnowskyi TaxID=360622 RepID=A0AAD8IN14_9APIA|nr:hypothetical protein POM88_015926 [Heracleum sosnowskyi]